MFGRAMWFGHASSRTGGWKKKRRRINPAPNPPKAKAKKTKKKPSHKGQQWRTRMHVQEVPGPVGASVR